MSDSKLKKGILSGMVWKVMEQGGRQIIRLIIQIILARLLVPKDFGLITIIGIFTSIGDVFVNASLGNALVQKKEIDDVDCSSVFYLNISFSAIVYSVIFMLAPVVSNFFNAPDLCNLLRVQAITVIIAGFNVIQSAIIQRRMQFKAFFIRQLLVLFVQGAVGISMAYLGFGVWSLVISTVVSSVVGMISLWKFAKWRPKLLFSIHRVLVLFRYGIKLLLSNLIQVGSDNLANIIVGKAYNPTNLGFYSKGIHLPDVIISTMDGPIQSVLFPAMSKKQDDKAAMRKMAKRMIMTSCFITIPSMFGLAAVATPLITVMYTSKWLPAVFFLQVLSIGRSIFPVHTTNLQVINALGRSDIFLKLEVFKTVLTFIIIALVLPHGIHTFVIAISVGNIFSMLLNAWPNKKLIDYGFVDQMKDIFPILFLSLAMAIIVYFIQFMGFSTGFTLLLQVFVGVIIYLGTAWLLKFECLKFVTEMLKPYWIRRKNSLKQSVKLD